MSGTNSAQSDPTTPTPTASARRRWWLMPGLVVVGLAGIGAAVEMAHFDAAAANLPSPAVAALSHIRFFDAAGTTPTPALNAASTSPASAARSESPEARLMTVFDLLDRHMLDDALQASLALEEDQPNFKLAHLVRATLLSARAARPVDALAKPGPQAEALDGLLLEADRKSVV